MKKKTTAQIIDKAAEYLQKYVRLKAADSNGYVSCVTCGVTRIWNDRMQGGHFIPRGRTATKLLEENVHPQCDVCNGPFGGTAPGNPVAYTLYMEDMYGRDFVEDLQSQAKETKKYLRCEAEALLKEWREKVKEIEG